MLPVVRKNSIQLPCDGDADAKTGGEQVLRLVAFCLQLRYNLLRVDGLVTADATQRIRRCKVQHRDTSYLKKSNESFCSSGNTPLRENRSQWV